MEKLLKVGFSMRSMPRFDFDLTWAKIHEQE
jgi:hypothetical protein